MTALIVFLYVVEVLVSVLLIGIVLIQQSKSQGGLGALAGGTTESIFGAATGNVITRTTVLLASLFLANTLLLAVLSGRTSDAPTRADELAAGALAVAGSAQTDEAVAAAVKAQQESMAEAADGEIEAPVEIVPEVDGEAPAAGLGEEPVNEAVEE